MMRLRHKALIHGFRLSDQISLWGSLILAIGLLGRDGTFRFVRDFLGDPHPPAIYLGGAALAVVWIFIFGVVVRYDANRFTSFSTTLLSALKATTLCSFALLIISQVFRIEIFSAPVIVAQWLISSLLVAAGRVVIRRLLTLVRRSGHNYRNVLFVGRNDRSLRLAASIEAQPELGYRIAGFIAQDDNPGGEGAPPPTTALPLLTTPPATPSGTAEQQPADRWPVVGQMRDIKTFLETGVIDEVMVCLPVREHLTEVFDLIRLGQDVGLVIRVIPDIFDLHVIEKAQIEVFEGDHVVTFFRESLLWQLLAKRILDLAISSVLLLFLFPFLCVVAVAIKVTSPGPIFFRQERMGMNKRKFTLYKFRSMGVDAEERKKDLEEFNEMKGGPAFKMKRDPRITPLGRWLRKMSIDEIPQLWNVIKGEMSLVGPRPPLANEVDKYEWLQRRRLSIKPGLTCLWQVGGRNNLTFEQWMELDREYCETWSIWLDLVILAKTVPVVLLGRGAS